MEIDSSQRSPHVLGWLLPVALVVGCARPPPAAPSRPAPIVLEGLERYLPLQDGFVYQYDVEADTGETGRVMVEVSRPRPGLVELSVAGKVQRLELSPEAARHATGGYLLKTPLEQGAEWKGQFGQVRLHSVTRSIRTPAGSFTGCLETVEEATVPTPKRATSVFCPGVGMVSLLIEGSVDGEAGSVGTVLRSYGPRATLD